MKINSGKPIGSQNKNEISPGQDNVCNDIFLNVIQSVIPKDVPNKNNDNENLSIIKQIDCDQNKVQLNDNDHLLLPAAVFSMNQYYPVSIEQIDPSKRHENSEKKISSIIDGILTSIKKDNFFSSVHLDPVEITEYKSSGYYSENQELINLSKNDQDAVSFNLDKFNQHIDLPIKYRNNTYEVSEKKDDQVAFDFEKETLSGQSQLGGDFAKIHMEPFSDNANNNGSLDQIVKENDFAKQNHLVAAVTDIERSYVLPQHERSFGVDKSSQEPLKSINNNDYVEYNEFNSISEKIDIKRYTAKITVHPKDLGTITANIAFHENKATIEIISNSKAVESVLQNQLSFLRSHLEQSSLQIDSINVSYFDSSAQMSSEQHSSSYEHHPVEEKIKNPIKMLSKQNPSNNETDTVIDTYV